MSGIAKSTAAVPTATWGARMAQQPVPAAERPLSAVRPGRRYQVSSRWATPRWQA